MKFTTAEVSLSKDVFDKAVKSALGRVNTHGISNLTQHQSKALLYFLCGKDSFVCLPTGHGKSLIYQLDCGCFRTKKFYFWFERESMRRVDFLKRPSLLISGSGGRPARKGLLSLAARQIYRRNFPPVDLVQSETVLLTCRQSNWFPPYETWVRDWAVLIKLYRETSFDRSVFTVYYRWPEFNCKAEYSDYRNQVFIVLRVRFFGKIQIRILVSKNGFCVSLPKSENGLITD